MNNLYKLFLLLLLLGAINTYGQRKSLTYQDNVIFLGVAYVIPSFSEDFIRGQNVSDIYGILSPEISFLKRLGYTTSIQIGAEFHFPILSEGSDSFSDNYVVETASFQGFQIPVRFRKIFILDNLKNLNEGSRTINPQGLTIIAGGYYGFGNSFKTEKEFTDSESERIKSDKGNYGVIGALGYTWQSGSGIFFEVKRDISPAFEDINPLGEFQMTYFGFRAEINLFQL